MTERWSALAAPRAAIVAAVLAVAGTLMAASALTSSRANRVPAPQSSLAQLPAAARGAVSATLGAELPAYHLLSGPHGALSARNPAQRLSARFTRAGAEVRAGAIVVRIAPLAAATPRRTGPSGLAYDDGAVSEWYANGPLGVEQGFTVARPAGLPNDAHALTLAVALTSNAQIALSRGGRALTLRRGGAAPLSYGDLFARDARGRALPVWLTLRAGALQLHVDTRGAAYPLRIDPLLGYHEALVGGEEEIDEQKIVEHKGETEEATVAHGELGYSVALSADGNTALVGAPDDAHFTGAAWVFVRRGGEWVQQGPKLTAAEPAEGEPCRELSEEGGGCAFGRSVALSADGDTAMIGAPRQSEPCPGEPASECRFRGAVWVFTRSGTTWTAQGALTGGAEETPEGRFGRSVALSADGSTAIVGAPADRAGAGAVWAFARSGSTWSQLGSKIAAAEELGEAHFGGAVAVSGDGRTALVGGPVDGDYAGAAWLLTRTGESWSQQRLTGAEESGEARFGAAVALSADGSTALVGGRRDDHGEGAAWVFANAGGGWTQQGPKLTGGAEQPAEDEADFGASVALSGDGSTALVGAPHDDHGRGAAWLFTRAGASWSRAAPKLTSAKAGRGSFGTSVALRADALTAIVGAPTESATEPLAEGESPPYPGAGAAWPFSDPSLLPAVTGVAPSAGPLAGGSAVTISGERLADVQGVYFGGVPAQSFSVAGGVLTALTPKGKAPGDACVEVRTAEGISPSNPCPAEAEFAYLPVPAIASLTPSSGPTSGGTDVTIIGSGFTAGSEVAFGGHAATAVHYVNEDTLEALTPSAPEGEVNVVVTTAGGASAPARYLFAPPSSPPGAGAKGPAVLGFGPVADTSAGCRPALASRTIYVPGGHVARVKLRWQGVGTCRGKLRLTVRLKAKAGRRTVTVTKTLATAAWAVRAGIPRTVSVKLNQLGSALLKASRGPLEVSLTMLASHGKAILVPARRVRLVRRPATPLRHGR